MIFSLDTTALKIRSWILIKNNHPHQITTKQQRFPSLAKRSPDYRLSSCLVIVLKSLEIKLCTYWARAGKYLLGLVPFYQKYGHNIHVKCYHYIDLNNSELWWCSYHILNIFFTILRPASCILRPAFCTSRSFSKASRQGSK